MASFVSRRGDFGSPARRFWTELFTFVTTAVGAPSPLSGKLPTHPGVTCLGRGCDKYSTPLILSGPVSGGGGRDCADVDPDANGGCSPESKIFGFETRCFFCFGTGASVNQPLDVGLFSNISNTLLSFGNTISIQIRKCRRSTAFIVFFFFFCACACEPVSLPVAPFCPSRRSRAFPP